MSKADNRSRMPTVAQMVDEIRAVFPDLKVIYASEGGFSLGKKPDYSNAFTVPANYWPCAQIDVKGRK